MSANTCIVAKRASDLLIDLSIASHNDLGIVVGHRVERLIVPREQPDGASFLAYTARGARTTLAHNLGSNGPGNPPRHTLIADIKKHVRRAPRDANFYAMMDRRYRRNEDDDVRQA